jgi:hypothetical protein
MTRRFASSFPPLSEPKSAPRVAIESLVQACLVDLFNAYEVAFAPLPNWSLASYAVPEASVSETFRTADGGSGRLTLSLPTDLLEHMLGADSTSVRMDWARELANQLVGRIKNRLLSFGVRLELGLPTVLDTRTLVHQLQDLSGLRVYVGRTRHGLVLITVHGLPADHALSYVGTSANAAEGAMLWL